jgi:hypothetical protein
MIAAPAEEAAAISGAEKMTAMKPAAKKTRATKRVAVKVSDAAGASKAGAVKKTTSESSRASTAASARSRQAGGSIAWQPEVRAERVVRVLGNRRAAVLLGVAESQPSRWRKALEVPSSQVAPMLVDLDHIVARLQLIWDDDVIGDWLEGSNAFLDGVRPIDVLRVNGSGPVLEAIEAEAAGAYA